MAFVIVRATFCREPLEQPDIETLQKYAAALGKVVRVVVVDQ